MTAPRLILASSSPRRIELLRQVGFAPIVAAPNADETPMRGETPQELVRRLAKEKAQSIACGLTGAANWIVIAADTIVVAPGRKKILGKPVDGADARKMLKSLAGRTHVVFTGYCIQSVKKTVVRVVKSNVTMRAMSAADIAAYVDSGEPMDKAGSYAAQGIGMALIEKLSGSYTNVVGLPMAQLLKDLEKSFDVPLFQNRV
jgi:septum formation protein